MEFLVLIALAGYIYYLRNYADLRTPAEKEMGAVAAGIALFNEGRTDEALSYFQQRIKSHPKSAAAYLYLAKCYLATGQPGEAGSFLAKSVSLDDTGYEIHLETGKYYLGQRLFGEALRALDKAAVKSEGSVAEVYHLRALAHRELGNEQASLQDFETEKRLGTEASNGQNSVPIKQAALVDRRLLVNCLLTFFTSALLLWMIKHAESIHLPYLVAVFAAGSLGYVEPHKGWILALLQNAILWLSYSFLTTVPENGARVELENFSLYGCIILTFVGSFLGAFLKRAISN